jgi:hypothetical protein
VESASESNLKKSIADVLPFQSLQESWKYFATDVLSNASPDQRKAMRNAFFSGASIAYLLFLASLEAPSKSQSRALAQALYDDLDDFMRDELFGEIVQTEGNA